MSQMVQKVGELFDAIRQIQVDHWTIQLSKNVYAHLDYPDAVLIIFLFSFSILCFLFVQF